MSVTEAGPVSVDLGQLVKVGLLGPPVSGWGLPSQQLTKVNRAAGSQGPTGQRPRGRAHRATSASAPERAPATKNAAELAGLGRKNATVLRSGRA